MLTYFLRRLLFALPTLIIISLVTYAMSRLTSVDPVRANYNESPNAYLIEARASGLDRPAFYFTLTSCAFPDSTYQILPLAKREKLEHWTLQNGNWEAIYGLWQSLTSDLDPDLEQVSGPILIGFKNLRNIDRLDQLPAALNRLHILVDTLENNLLQPRLEQQLQKISARYEGLQQNRQPWKLAMPAFYWYGLNNQYHNWLGNFISGDPGRSIITGQPLLSEVRPRLVITLLLNGMALFLAYLIGVPLGVIMAQNHLRPFDWWTRNMLLFIYAMPVIWLGSLLILLLSRQDIGLGLIDGMNADPWLMSRKPFCLWFKDNAVKFVLPVLTLTLHTLAVIAIQMRSGVLEIIRQDYIRTARAKGLSESKVYWRHAFRNALFPIISVFAHSFPAIFGGSLVIEYLFDFPGMGHKMHQAFTSNDYAILFAMVLFVAFVTVIGNIVADMLYAWADPRIRFTKR